MEPAPLQQIQRARSHPSSEKTPTKILLCRHIACHKPETMFLDFCDFYATCNGICFSDVGLFQVPVGTLRQRLLRLETFCQRLHDADNFTKTPRVSKLTSMGAALIGLRTSFHHTLVMRNRHSETIVVFMHISDIAVDEAHNILFAFLSDNLDPALKVFLCSFFSLPFAAVARSKMFLVRILRLSLRTQGVRGVPDGPPA